MIKKVLRGVPIFGGLVDARWRDHQEALCEVGIGIVLSTAPIWLGCVFLMAAKKFSIPYLDLVSRNVENGELFIYSTAIVAPLFYFLFKEVDATKPRRFPQARGFNFIAIIILLIGGCGFTITRLLPILGIPFPWAETTFFSFSLFLYISAAIVVYLAHVYRNWRESGGSAAFSSDTQDFVKAYNDGRKS